MEAPVVVRAGSALVGPELRTLNDACIVIRGERIDSVGASSETPVPEGADVVDAPGCVLIPGFIDAHVHICFHDPHDVVFGGVTTARDLGWPPERIHPVVAESLGASFDGPTLLAAGPMLTVAGGYPTRAAWAPHGTGRTVDGPGAAVETVGRTAEEGASVIKVALNPDVGPTLDPATLAAIVDAAHERRLKVTAHASNVSEVEKAVRCGVDELAHMVLSAERLPDETIEKMVSAGMAVVPTLSIMSGEVLDAAVENLARFLDAGGTVVYGTDLGNAGPLPGIDPMEVRAMERAGMTPAEIIRSGTSLSAGWLGLEGVGVIEDGAVADLVGLATGEPYEALEKVEMVWRRGIRVR